MLAAGGQGPGSRADDEGVDPEAGEPSRKGDGNGGASVLRMHVSFASSGVQLDLQWR